MVKVKTMKPPYRVAVVGAAGQQGREHLATLQRLPDLFTVCALADVQAQPLSKLAHIYHLSHYASVDDLLVNEDFDVALVALPHHEHFRVTRKLLGSGKHVIKEKPIALGPEEADILVRTAVANSVSLFVIAQRSHQPAFDDLRRAIGEIGDAFSFKYEYHKNFDRATSSWRSRRGESGGGVALDMGYHVFDVLVRVFGAASSVSANASYCYPETRKEALEDAVSVVLDYGARNLQGTVLISRHHYQSTERFEVLGTRGALVATPDRLQVFTRSGQIVNEKTYTSAKQATADTMLGAYGRGISDFAYFMREARIHTEVITVIDQVYAQCIELPRSQPAPLANDKTLHSPPVADTYNVE